ncbi:MAG TPA: 1-acyl-sn-glycerol-3-phosphate acyltransferase [Thermoanaerobaculia bacterium]|nr:1-acyl-sn-glycerol-3-phosphate acyltransferase [Thermoanaerobaculia bacterium]
MRYLLLLFVKLISTTFWNHRYEWVGEPLPGNRWGDIRLVVILNHTSLLEWVFSGMTPNSFMRDVAEHGVVPVAAKTIQRPLVGKFFSVIAAHVVPISRQRDHTWATVLAKVDDDRSMVIILPEGRMMRKDGLDSEGKPMTLRGGVADLLREIPTGRMLLAYSGGLHHVQAPGDKLPRLFKTVRMNFEAFEIADYREKFLAEHGEKGFRDAVVADLTARRNRHCPVTPGSAPGLEKLREETPPA